MNNLPLSGVRVVEMAGIGPAPFCGMLLAQMGADVMQIDRKEASGLGVAFPVEFDHLNRGKTAVALDLKDDGDRDVARALIDRADILIEGFRPGVMERIGLGPESFRGSNPRLVFGRVTGWGQAGPLSNAAGHDLNYISLTGALAAIDGPDGAPGIPLSLVGDFAGGAMYLLTGVLAALVAARQTGEGQTVDAAIVDGCANLMTIQYGLLQSGMWTLDRGRNLLDGGAPFYSVYRTGDDRWVSVAAVEPKFFSILISKLGLDPAQVPQQYDRSGWPKLRDLLAATFRTRTREEWSSILEGSDACFAPVLDMEEARTHPHMLARGVYPAAGGTAVPAPAPRFSGAVQAEANPVVAPLSAPDALARWQSEPAARRA